MSESICEVTGTLSKLLRATCNALASSGCKSSNRLISLLFLPLYFPVSACSSSIILLTASCNTFTTLTLFPSFSITRVSLILSSLSLLLGLSIVLPRTISLNAMFRPPNQDIFLPTCDPVAPWVNDNNDLAVDFLSDVPSLYVIV